jgi:ABC-2 type transport system permease protein
MKLLKLLKSSFSGLRPIYVKEFRQIKRDIRMILLLLLFPAVLLVMLGYALNFDVKHVKIVICDQDKSAESRKLINQFQTTEYFDLITIISERQKIDDYLMHGEAKVCMVIPYGFRNKILNNENINLQVICDGSDANTAGTALNYIMLVSQNYSQNLIFDLSDKLGIKINQPLELASTVWFNPELKTVKFLIPGLVAFILMIVCTISTALSIVREKENGTMEQLLVSPLHAFEIILGKTIPYFVFSLVASTLILLFGIILFDIAIKGNIFLLYLNIVLFIFGALGMGIFISTISDSQQIAFMIAALATLLPTFILSGFIFPIKNMPVVLQIISYIIPAKYFIIILRGIILKGVGIAAFWEQFVFLLLFAILIFTLSSIRSSRGRIK